MKKILLLFSLILSFEVMALNVVRHSPSGNNVRYQQQISISFDTDMVALGDNNKLDDIPITITPNIKCHWHWVDTKNLNCQLDEYLPDANKFTVVVSKKLKSYKGESLAKDYRFSFETIRPKVSYISTKGFQSWASPVRPQLSLNFNMPVRKASVEKALKFDFENKYEVIYRDDYGCKDDVCQYWDINILEDLKRGAEYNVEVRTGVETPSGKLQSNQSKSKNFKTAPQFTITQVVCSYQTDDGYNRDETYYMQMAEVSDFSKNKRCEPHLTKRVDFSLPVIPQKAYQSVTIEPNPSGKSDVNPFSMAYGYDSDYPTSFLYLPNVLNSKQTYTFDFSKVESIFGDKLTGSDQFKIGFIPRSPAVKLQYSQAVVESQIKNDVPILITNNEEFNLSYSLWNHTGNKSGLNKKIKTPLVFDITYMFPLGLANLVEAPSGAINYKIKELSNRYDRERDHFAELTPYQIVAKLGHFNTKIWVLDLKSGEMVEDAEVSISKWGGKDKIGATVKTDDEGIANLPGLNQLSYDLAIFNGYELYKRYYVSVKKGKEFAVLPIHYEYAANTYYSNVYPSSEKEYGHLKAWGLTPQGVYKAGSDIQFKLFVRNEANERITAAPKELKYNLKVEDPMGKIVKEYKDIKLSKFGTYQNTLFTSKTALSGNYQFKLEYEPIDEDKLLLPQTIHCFSVLISDFKPAAFKPLVRTDKSLVKNGENLKIIAEAKMHSGGPFGGTESRITIELVKKYFKSKDKKYKDFNFDTQEYFNESNRLATSTEVLPQNGEREYSLTINQEIPYGSLYIENAVKDDRGKFISARTTAEYYGRSLFLGGKLDRWSYQVGDDVEINHVVLNENSKLAKNQKVQVVIEHESVTAAKVKGSGNAYVTKYNREWKEAHKCEIKITKDENICEFEPSKPGYYRVLSNIDGQAAKWQEFFYVVGKGRFLWGGDDNDHLDLATSESTVSIGDKVKTLIKNPFDKAKALITIERYGVIDQWIIDIDKSAYMFEFKVKPNYLPGFYLSVNLFSHRAAKANGFGKLDLGKPAMRIGYLQFDVRDDYKKIDIEIESDKKKYLPGEEVELEFEAEAKNGKLKDVEIAVAVLDEAVFDLISNGIDYFDPYKGLFRLDSLDVKTFSLLKQLIGRQKFEKKGANQGGDGGAQGPKVRSFIDYLAYWNPAIKVDDDGEGKIKFKLPDNLTGWKVIAIAVDESDRMGVSTNRFVVNQPTEIRAALPNQVIEGDVFNARFTVLNREPKKRELKIILQAAGNVIGDEKSRNLSFTKELAPNERYVFEHNVKVSPVKQKRAQEQGEVRFLLKAGDSLHTDIFIKNLIVNKMRPEVNFARYGDVAENSNDNFEIKYPQNIYPDVGGLTINASTTLLGHLEDGFKYLKKYPYACWEQKLSKAVAAAQFLKLKKFLPMSFEWNEANDLVVRTLKEASSFQLDSGAMSYYGEYPAPYLSAFTLNAFAWLEKYGYEVPKSVKNKLISYNQNLLKKNHFEKFWSLSMRSSVRAIALAGLSEFGVLKHPEFNRHFSKIEQISKFAQLHYYQAGINLQTNKNDQILKTILNSLIIDSGKAALNEFTSEEFQFIHSSNRRTQCAALNSFVTAMSKNYKTEKILDLPAKFLRGIIEDMQAEGLFWNTTQASIFCLNAFINYASFYEKAEPNLIMTTTLEDKPFGELKLKGRIFKGKSIYKPLNDSDIGTTKKLKIENKGKGRLYYKANVSYASKDKNQASNHGIAIDKIVHVQRENKWIPVTDKTELKRGELVRFDLIVQVPKRRHFVVIDDPIAGGLEPVNTDLATASTVDSDSGKIPVAVEKMLKKKNHFSYGYSPYSFYFKELKHDRATFYSTLLNLGQYHVAYTAQVIATGKFIMMPAKAMEMYRPETYGMTNRGELNVAP